MTQRVLVTGANGHLGRLLLARLGQRGRARALVRSERAARSLADLEAPGLDTRVVDWNDIASVASAAEGFDAVVHLVGIIKETSNTSFEDAHERSCRALVEVSERAAIERIVYLSIFGADVTSANACLASKARAEAILAGASTPSVSIRLPMVLGPGDYASFALAKQARSGIVPLAGGGRTLQQPIYALDVLSAIESALDSSVPAGVFELGGPEALPHRDLVARAAKLYGKEPRILSVPLFLVRSFAALASSLSANPPLSPAMLGVLQHDDDIDPAPACSALGITLTPLDETLRCCVGPEATSA